MRPKYILFLLIATLGSGAAESFGFSNKGVELLRATESHILKTIPEPSDVVFDRETGHLFIVSDRGILFECDMAGKVIRKAPIEGMDFEGVEIKGGFVYVTDEKPRIVFKFRKSDLALVSRYKVKWEGGLNRAYEGITYNYAKNCFIMVAERPATLVEFDTLFHELHRYPLAAIDKRFADLSMAGARWHEGKLFLLSSSASALFNCSPTDYSITSIKRFQMADPEGVDFDGVGNMIITSDNCRKIYYFKNISNINHQ